MCPGVHHNRELNLKMEFKEPVSFLGRGQKRERGKLVCHGWAEGDCNNRDISKFEFKEQVILMELDLKIS